MVEGTRYCSRGIEDSRIVPGIGPGGSFFVLVKYRTQSSVFLLVLFRFDLVTYSYCTTVARCELSSKVDMGDWGKP